MTQNEVRDTTVICPDCDGTGCYYCGGLDASEHTAHQNCCLCIGTGFLYTRTATDRLMREVDSVVQQVRMLRIENEILLKQVQRQDKLIRSLQE